MFRTARRLIALLAVLLVTAAPSVARSASPEELIFLHYWTGPLSGGISEMVKAFNVSSSRYTVRVTGFEHESFKVGITVMLDSGNPPDLFSYWAGARVQALVDKGQLASIDQVWQSAGLDAVFPPAIGDACTYDGRKYALPITQHYVGFFYNKAIFDRLHITPPKTWDEFLAACDRLRLAGVIPIALGSRERWPAQFWFDYLLLRTAGPEYRQRLMDGRARYADSEVLHAFTLWRSLIQHGFFNQSPNRLDWAEAAGQVHSGKAGMTLMGSWLIGHYETLGWKQQTDYDVFPFPVVTPGVPSAAVGPIDVIVVPEEGKPEQVSKVLPFFSQPGPQMEMSLGSGALAPSQGVPRTFYSPMQEKILDIIRTTPHWAFNYDLATPPNMAESGLQAFREFVADPESLAAVISRLDRKARALFAAQTP